MMTDELPELVTVKPNDLDKISKALGSARRVFHISIGGLTHILCATKCKYENFKGKSNKGKCNTMYIEFKDVNGTGFAELMCYVDLHAEKTTDYVCFTYRKRYTFDCPSTTKPYEFKRDKLINGIKGKGGDSSCSKCELHSSSHRLAQEFPFVRNASDGTELTFYESAFGVVKSWNGHLSGTDIKIEYLDEWSSSGMIPMSNIACTYYETSHYRYEWWKDAGYAIYGWTPPFFVYNVRGSQLIWRRDEMNVMGKLTQNILKLLWDMGIMYRDTSSQRKKLKESRILVYKYIINKFQFNPSGIGLPGLKREKILSIGFDKWKNITRVKRSIANIRSSLKNRVAVHRPERERAYDIRKFFATR